MSWFTTFDGVFFITITTIITGFMGLSIRYCMKSKCDDVNICFGLFKIHRRVELEQEIDRIEEGKENSEFKETDEFKEIEQTSLPSPTPLSRTHGTINSHSILRTKG